MLDELTTERPRACSASVTLRAAYSEPTSDEQALPLIADAGRGVQGWIAGLRSPWKGGYISEHGGRTLAALYCAAEAVMSRLPQTKPALRRLLIRNG